MKRNLRQNNSGQVLIVSALLLALVLLATAFYVIQSERTVPTAQTSQNSFTAYQQGAKNSLISALSNITNGGNSSVLASDLERFSSAITSQSFQSMLQIQTNPATTAPYQNGLHISWGTNGYGISSACTDFLFSSTTNSQTQSSQYTLNVTTEISYTGKCWLLEGKFKQVNLTINVYNDARAALAQNFTFLYDFDGLLSTQDWLPINASSTLIHNYGNGTYFVSLILNLTNETFQLRFQCNVLIKDGIMVAAELTFMAIEKP
jgi:hypothetical protein